ncbi:MAG: hypothetical protein AAB229_08470 [Candidatus Hydrogenedentota bacterium]
MFWLITLACTLVLLMFMDEAAARAEVITEQSISMSGIVLIHPCTMEQLRLEGNMLFEARSTIVGDRARIGLTVHMESVKARDETTGIAYECDEPWNDTLNIGPLPAADTAIVKVLFSGPAQNPFQANMTLQINADSSGSVQARLWEIKLECR